MPRQATSSAASATVLAAAAAPAVRPELSAGTLGESGSRDALTRLNAAMAELKAMAVQPMLERAVEALKADDYKAGQEWAIKALSQDERNGFGWYLLAIARERVGDFASSVKAYEAALQLIPDQAEVANDLGRLAFRMGMPSSAEKLFVHFLNRYPDHPEGCNNLACALREQGRLDEAVDVLRPAIELRPDIPMLWNTLGTVVGEKGDFANAEMFFNEALRIDPDFPKARYNLGNARLALGDPEGALEACETAMAAQIPEDERQMMRLSRSTILMALGRIGEGWDEYEARLHPRFADITRFLVDRPLWQPGDDIAGKRLLVLGEQGLGDEVLFGNMIPDILERLGPDGRLTLALEHRLVPLFRRTFPQATVGPHATYTLQARPARVAPFIEDMQSVDLYTPMASLLREYRREVDQFPDRERFLDADPERVAYWKAQLEVLGAGPKVGLLWKSAITKTARQRYFSPFEAWTPVLEQPGVKFINLQYGDCSAELAQVEANLGVEIWTPPGIDLKQDLDEVAALACALDLTIGFSNATLNLAAACGAPTWLISTPGAWTRLGTDRYPWYPQVRVFAPTTFGAWDELMAEVGEALGAWAER